jgi:hypothetical protein
MLQTTNQLRFHSIQHEEMQPVQLLKELPRILPHLGSQWPGAQKNWSLVVNTMNLVARKQPGIMANGI